MDVTLIWSLAVTGYSLMSAAAIAVAWVFWRHASPGRETLSLCGSLLALALHYICRTMDAFLHATGTADRLFTVWSAFGQTALIGAGALFVLSLLITVTRVYPTRPDRWLVGAIVGQVGAALTIGLWTGGQLAWALLDGWSPDAVAYRIDRICGPAGNLANVLAFTGTLALMSGLVENVPAHGRARWTRWLADGGPWHALTASDVKDIAGVSPTSAMTRRFRVTAMAFLWAAFVLSTIWADGSSGWTAYTLSGTALLRVLLLPALLAIVYYHARFFFFDVLIKRGVVLGALALLSMTSGFTIAALLLPIDARPYVAIGCAIATILIAVLAGLIDSGNRWLDRILFHRPNYRAQIDAISSAMAECADVESLTTVVTARLKDALGATFVEYGAHRAECGEVVIPLGESDPPRGHLALGPRRRRQQYGSEDLTFIDAVAARFATHLKAFEARRSAELAAAAEVRALRAQVNPHFLFNALNTLAEMSRGQPAVERTIINLSQVFRYALESTQREHVPLGSEIDAIRAYLEIEAERFEDNLQFEIDVPDDVRDALVPPMLIQPLVENSVKHGLSAKVDGGTVRIGALRNNGHLQLMVQDDGVGFDFEHTPRRVGLANVGARVEQTGGSWRVQSIPGAGTLVTLALVTP